MRERGPVPPLPFMGICLFPRRASPFAAGEGRKRGFDKRESLGRERGRFGGGEGTLLQKGSLSPPQSSSPYFFSFSGGMRASMTLTPNSAALSGGL